MGCNPNFVSYNSNAMVCENCHKEHVIGSTHDHIVEDNPDITVKLSGIGRYFHNYGKIFICPTCTNKGVSWDVLGITHLPMQATLNG